MENSKIKYHFIDLFLFIIIYFRTYGNEYELLILDVCC